MEATLEVTSAGTPVPRPEPGIAVKIVSKDLQRVVSTGKLKLGIRSVKGSLTVGARAKAGKKLDRARQQEAEVGRRQGRRDAEADRHGAHGAPQAQEGDADRHGDRRPRRRPHRALDVPTHAGLSSHHLAMLIDAVEWLGHSGFRIQAGRTTIYIDPYRVAPDAAPAT